ncbi:hypothetical protein [Coleofasciculus sp. FACHB-1120]|uniref:hypothetical protein n=1 Tax=Coleofasciculus sp. FACHB-1120 TaxID=2692783 RepID=UPI0016860E18|nr:hypothetical protein [Coleofasciculus sp. FACHB-1120]MBD2743222.1 hypothetical protein [Coleofasciculus sp. FACHB-1120]
MQPALHISTKVLPGNKIEISTPDLPVGDAVEVFVILPETPISSRRSAIDLLDELPGQRLFKTTQEADQYIEEERNAWEP